MTAAFFRREDDALIMQITVRTKASKAGLGPVVDGRLKVSVNAPPVDGKANRAIIKLLARECGLAPSAITITHGEKSRQKTVRIDVQENQRGDDLCLLLAQLG